MDRLRQRLNVAPVEANETTDEQVRPKQDCTSSPLGLLFVSTSLTLSEQIMKYYFFNKRSAAAHIWTGSDTACRMYSTGGIRQNGKVHDSHGARRVCNMCQNVMARTETPALELSDIKIYLW